MTTLRTVLLLLATAGYANLALAQDSATKVKVQPSLSKTDAKGYQELKLDVQIEKGWHVYANAPQNPDFEANKTIVRIGGPKVEDVTVKYPEGTIRTDTLNNKVIEFRVYEGTVSITARLKRVDAAPLEVDLQVFACDPNNCLRKGVVKLKVP